MHTRHTHTLALAVESHESTIIFEQKYVTGLLAFASKAIKMVTTMRAPAARALVRTALFRYFFLVFRCDVSRLACK